nr:ribosomal protein S3 [Ophiocordyceps sinensis]ARF03432.1 ribosomal protein S3 [Ophiocordyceps sinensis]
MKIFNNNLNNNSKTIALRKKRGDTGKIKYLPSFSKEWKNIIYCYNKNSLKNIPVNNVNINKIIKSYFNLYFKNHKFVGSKKFILLKRRRNFLRRIYVSNAEIKHTNNKAIITLYTVNRESLILKKKYFKINKKVNQNLIERFLLLYKENVACINNKASDQSSRIYEIFHNFSLKNKEYLYESTFSADRPIPKKIFINYKLKYFNIFIKFQNIYLKKIWSLIISKYWNTHLKWLRKYDLMYSLNKYKFNKQIFLPILSKILNKIIRKKIVYNIINLKSIAYNTDLFTNALALKLKRKKNFSIIWNMFSILNRAYLPVINTIKTSGFAPLKGCSEAAGIESLHSQAQNINLFLSAPHKYKDLKLISILNNTAASVYTYPFSLRRVAWLQDQVQDLDQNNFFAGPAYPEPKVMDIPATHKLLGDCSNTKQIHNTIYNSIGYKNMRGIRLEIKGRLTKRYRADRSVYSLKWKGGLKNVDSSLKGLSSVLFRGNSNSNVSYSIYNSKRRIGAFAVKGWISGGSSYSTMAAAA